jgi:hypothetical protein
MRGQAIGRLHHGRVSSRNLLVRPPKSRSDLEIKIQDVERTLKSIELYREIYVMSTCDKFAS